MLLGEIMSSAQICLLAISFLHLLWLCGALRYTALHTVSRTVNGSSLRVSGPLHWDGVPSLYK